MSQQKDNEEIRQLLNSALDKQFNKGLAKYGQGVEVDQPGIDWIEEAIEEVMDAQVYLAAKLLQLRRLTKKH
tara:strand:+ start:119 stop:334 length:216 start_codon:yes stop_codon:yes gene_type:complete